MTGADPMLRVMHADPISHRGMRLGFILEPRTANSLYRVIYPMRALERRGHTVLWPSRLQEDIPFATLAGCDLVHCFRRLGRLADLRRLASMGVAISFDNDDLLSAIDVSSTGSGREISGHRGKFANMKKFAGTVKAAKLADLVTTPSALLAQRYEAAGAARVAVIENHIDERSMAGHGSRTRHDGLVVGWVAAKEHERDLSQVPVVAAIRSLLRRHSRLRVHTVGTRLPLEDPRYEFTSYVQPEQLVRTTGSFDIGIAPLADTPFNRARSNVKLKEYAAGGAAWLASPIGGYEGMGRREGGRLVADDQWLEALDSLIRGRLTRRSLSRQAHRWARAQTMDNHVHAWEREFLAAIERARTRAAGARPRAARRT